MTLNTMKYPGDGVLEASETTDVVCCRAHEVVDHGNDHVTGYWLVSGIVEHDWLFAQLADFMRRYPHRRIASLKLEYSVTGEEGILPTSEGANEVGLHVDFERLPRTPEEAYRDMDARR